MVQTAFEIVHGTFKKAQAEWNRELERERKE